MGEVSYPGEQLRETRESLRLTQGELARLFDCGESTIRKWERVGAPVWVPYALIGVGTLERGVPIDEMARRVGLAEWEAAHEVAAHGSGETGPAPSEPKGR